MMAASRVVRRFQKSVLSTKCRQDCWVKNECLVLVIMGCLVIHIAYC